MIVSDNLTVFLTLILFYLYIRVAVIRKEFVFRVTVRQCARYSLISFAKISNLMFFDVVQHKKKPNCTGTNSGFLDVLLQVTI